MAKQHSLTTSRLHHTVCFAGYSVVSVLVTSDYKQFLVDFPFLGNVLGVTEFFVQVAISQLREESFRKQSRDKTELAYCFYHFIHTIGKVQVEYKSCLLYTSRCV